MRVPYKSRCSILLTTFSTWLNKAVKVRQKSENVKTPHRDCTTYVTHILKMIRKFPILGIRTSVMETPKMLKKVVVCPGAPKKRSVGARFAERCRHKTHVTGGNNGNKGDTRNIPSFRLSRELFPALGTSYLVPQGIWAGVKHTNVLIETEMKPCITTTTSGSGSGSTEVVAPAEKFSGIDELIAGLNEPEEVPHEVSETSEETANRTGFNEGAFDANNGTGFRLDEELLRLVDDSTECRNAYEQGYRAGFQEHSHK